MTTPPAGSSDEILIPQSWPDSGAVADGPRAAAEEALREALRARCGDAVPRWADVLAVVRKLWRRHR